MEKTMKRCILPVFVALLSIADHRGSIAGRSQRHHVQSSGWGGHLGASGGAERQVQRGDATLSGQRTPGRLSHPRV